LLFGLRNTRRRRASDYDGGVNANTPEERAAQRANWPIRRFRLGEEPEDDLLSSTTPEQRVAMVWSLTLDAWASAGREIPAYDRSNIPCRYFPSGSPPPEDDFGF
jgi:hypothetical protein